MQIIANLNLASALDTLISLLSAFVLGGIIGLERQYRQRTAGLRTNVLVAVGAAIFIDIGNRIGGNEGIVRVVAYVVSGVGFLGAGVIMREEGNVRGINTAATLWGSAAVGACAGADLIVEAILATIFVLAANTLLRPVVNRINRQPMDTESVEVTNTVYVIAPLARQKEAMQRLADALEQANYPAHSLEVEAFGDDAVQIEATLSATAIDGDQIDMIIQKLQQQACINQAYWSPSTTE